MPAEYEALRIAIVPGVTVAKWTKAWQERRRRPLEVIPVDEAAQLAVLHDGRADVSFVRLPIEREGLSVIRLYSEAPVVVVGKDHPISLFDTVTQAELADELLRTEDPADAVEIVAAGVGVLRVPHSVARLHARKDTVAVPVSDADETEIAVVWLAENTTPDIEEFIGVVRGRRPGSSRGPARTGEANAGEADAAIAQQQKPAKPAPKQGGGAPRGGGKAKARPAAKRPPKSKARGSKKGR